MGSHDQNILVLVMVTLATFVIPSYGILLTPDYYNKVCPQAQPIIKSIVLKAIIREPRIGASLLRLHFHDCFVNGCDGSVLLDDTPFFIGEKTAPPNNNSLRGFEVIDEIKAAVDKACKGPVVSCADILAIAARDSVALLGGPQFWYRVLLGRRDARYASIKDTKNLPPHFSASQSFFPISNLMDWTLKTLCSFKDRIFNDTNIDYKFASTLRKTCPKIGHNSNLAPLDATPAKFDTTYYKALLYKKGLLHSDQELFKGDGSESDRLVYLYSQNPYAFAKDFGVSMIKMGNIRPLTGKMGEIRL
ncbi:Secretory peroxidase [Sesbania bispinosa]|nr:Secretory peroxidase [Sesbania bispinosa]